MPRFRVVLVVGAVLGAVLAVPTAASAAPVLLSQGKPTLASSEGGSGYVASNAVDGRTSTRWASVSHVDPQWLRVDLGRTSTISEVKLTWDTSCATSYQIQVSSDGNTFTSVYSTTTGDGATDDVSISGSGRYVRMFGTVRCRDAGYSLQEFQVFGTSTSDTTPPSTPTNLHSTSVTATSASLAWTASTDDTGVTGYDVYSGTTAVASSSGASATVSGLTPNTTYSFSVKAKDAAGHASQASSALSVTTSAATPVLLSQNKPASASSEGGSGYVASNAFDGSTSTRWASVSHVDPQWLRVDLGAVSSLTEVRLTWDVSCATSYQIQVSNDGTTFTTVSSTTTGDGGTDDVAISGSGRYVRMFGTVRCRDAGYSLQEMQVFGVGGPPPPGPGRAQILATLKSVAAYWIANGFDTSLNDWQNATFHEGNLAYVTESGTSDQASMSWATKLKFGLNSSSKYPFFPDLEAAGEVYLDLDQRHPDPSHLAAIRKRVSEENKSVAGGKVDNVAYVDALNMALPSFARLGVLDNSSADLTSMQKMFTFAEKTAGKKGLFNESNGLWWRDKRYVGGNIYWSRGNGWAIMAMAKLATALPSSDARRAEFVRVLVKMAAALAKTQRSDGFWNVDLGNPNSFPGPETSGTAFFTYGIAWGINNGVLPASTYRPIVEKAWAGMMSKAIHSNGLVGYVQGTGSSPSEHQPVKSTDTSAYGVGGVLLAGTEMAKLES